MEKFRDSRLPLAERVDALLSQLTADEKCGFINYRNEGVPRLGIPPYVWWNEALHGLARSGSSTVFPQAIAMAATFTPELVEKMGETIAAEGRARHFDARKHGDFGTYKGLTYWSPNVNIYRDPRWGRGQETYGECPFLTGKMGAAYVRGVQGPDPEHPRAAATPKHFAAHSGPEATRLGFDSEVSEKDLRETYLPAFRKCLDAGALSIMSAYNALNGIPCSANSRLFKEILREEWNFTGVVVTDAGTGDAMVRHHKCSPDYPSALAAELHAGIDVITDWPYGAREALERGLISEADLDRAVRNQLLVLFALGMFDDVPRDVPPPEVIECAAHRKLALEASRRSIVLLKNRNHLLPLDPQKGGTLAVIGPNADSREVLLGNYCGTPTRSVTLLEGVLAAAEPHWNIIYARGCEPAELRTEGCAEDGDRIAEAVSAAERSDAVLLCVGLNPQIEGEGGDAFNSDSAGDKPTLELPGLQNRLIEAVAAVGKPVILAVVSGGALLIPEAQADAVIQCFYPGAEGGTAFADVLFGRFNPSGRLPVTFYRSVADLPPFEDYSMANRTYRFFAGEVMHPFGFGLSYTEFVCSALSAPQEVQAGKSVEVEISIENRGEQAGEEVVQLYLAPVNPPTPAPIRQLAAVARVTLAPGESKQVKLLLEPDSFLLTFNDGHREFGKGVWEIWAGTPPKRDVSTKIKIS